MNEILKTIEAIDKSVYDSNQRTRIELVAVAAMDLIAIQLGDTSSRKMEHGAKAYSVLHSRLQSAFPERFDEGGMIKV